MIDATALVEMIDGLEAEALQRWIDRGWVVPRREGDDLHFDATDVARTRLICELHYELRIEEDNMSVVLSLMDQLYRARRSLRTLVSAVAAQPEEVRASITTLLEANIGNSS